MKRKHPTLSDGQQKRDSTLSHGEQKRDPTLSDGEQKRDLLLCIFDLFICIFGYQKDVTVGESLFPSLCVASTKGFRGDRRKAIATYRRLLKCSLRTSNMCAADTQKQASQIKATFANFMPIMQQKYRGNNE